MFGSVLPLPPHPAKAEGTSFGQKGLPMLMTGLGTVQRAAVPVVNPEAKHVLLVKGMGTLFVKDYTNQAKAGAYAQAARTDNTGKYVGATQGSITYNGINGAGQNLGVAATLVTAMSSQARGGNDGEPAVGAAAYFHNKHALGMVIHRGHLVAKCLGGAGDILNWVPLKAYVNYPTMWFGVEKHVWDWLSAGRGRVVFYNVTPFYGNVKLPTIPTLLLFNVQCREGAGALGAVPGLPGIAFNLNCDIRGAEE